MIGSGILDRRLSRALTRKLGRPYHMETEGYGDWIRIKVQLTDGLLDVFVKKRRLFNETTYLFLAWLIGTSLGMIGIAVIFMRNQVRPIRRLAVAVDEFGKGRDVPDLVPFGRGRDPDADDRVQHHARADPAHDRAADGDAGRRLARPADALDPIEAAPRHSRRGQADRRPQIRCRRDGIAGRGISGVRRRRRDRGRGRRGRARRFSTR